MKKVMLMVVVISLMLSSCVTSKGRYIPRTQTTMADRNTYNVLGEATAITAAPKFWLLFIPFGGMSDQGLYNSAYRKALKEFSGANGLMSEQIEYKKVKIPLLLVTLVYKQVRVTGVAYHIKDDAEISVKK